MIIEDYSEHIDQFECFLRTKLNNMFEIQSDDKQLFKQVLYVTFLDSLAASVYPKRGNRERFIALLEQFCCWEYANRYCILHLAKFTSLTSDPEYQSIRKYTHDLVKSWPDKVNGVGVIRVETLPSSTEVESHWNSSKASGDKGVNLDDFKYSNLMYQLRNSLVHQLQRKGSEVGGGVTNEPYYQLYKTYEEPSLELKPSVFELVFPTPMLYALCKTALKNVCKYFRNGNINPFPHYYSGDYWLRNLN